MALLENHLEQISLCATAIAELPFLPPKIFANALLRNHDITTLIRDTEAYERALFSVNPSTSSGRATRRGTMFPGVAPGQSMASRIYAARDPRNRSAVSRVLGGDMMMEIERSSRSGVSNSGAEGKVKGEIDIEILLRGAEKLCDVYPVAGAPEKIASIRNRHQQVIDSIAHYENRVAMLTAQLERMNRSKGFGKYYDEEGDDEASEGGNEQEDTQITTENLQREQEEIRDLELKKKALEERVSGMERDLGGLNR